MSADWGDVFPSAAVSGETAAVVDMVANDWRSDEDWRRFEAACRAVAVVEYESDYSFDSGTRMLGRFVNPNRVREHLTNEHGLTIEPRRYSAFWSRAAGKNGFLDADGWVENTDHKGGNAGKPLRRYRLRSSVAGSRRPSSDDIDAARSSP